MESNATFLYRFEKRKNSLVAQAYSSLAPQHRTQIDEDQFAQMRHVAHRVGEQRAAVLAEVVVDDLQMAQRGAASKSAAQRSGALFVRTSRGPAEILDVRQQGQQLCYVLRSLVATHVVEELQTLDIHRRVVPNDVQQILAGIHRHPIVVKQKDLQILLSLQISGNKQANGNQLLAGKDTFRSQGIIAQIEVLQMQILETLGKGFAGELGIIKRKARDNVGKVQIL